MNHLLQCFDVKDDDYPGLSAVKFVWKQTLSLAGSIGLRFNQAESAKGSCAQRPGIILKCK